MGGDFPVGCAWDVGVEFHRFTEEPQAIFRNDGKLTLISDRLHWARSYLKKADVFENSSRGVWTVTMRRPATEPRQWS